MVVMGRVNTSHVCQMVPQKAILPRKAGLNLHIGEGLIICHGQREAIQIIPSPSARFNKGLRTQITGPFGSSFECRYAFQ